MTEFDRGIVGNILDAVTQSLHFKVASLNGLITSTCYLMNIATTMPDSACLY
jgi:hypothetical protein